MAAPLYRRVHPEPADPGREALLARRDVLVHELREMDDDRRAGTLDEASYERARVRTEREAARVLRAIQNG